MGHRLKFCLMCSSGRHGCCLIYNCACAVSACQISRTKGDAGDRLMIRKDYLPKEFETKLVKDVTAGKGSS